MKLIQLFFIISNASLESGFKSSHSVCHFSIFPFQMTIANIWWVSCEVFSNVQKNFTCRMNLASMCTNIFISHLVKVGIETRKLNPINYSWLYDPRKLSTRRTRKNWVLISKFNTIMRISSLCLLEKNHGCVPQACFYIKSPN